MTGTTTGVSENCEHCGHTLTENEHGMQDEDVYRNQDNELTHCGTCSGCVICNPVLVYGRVKT